MYRAYYDGDAFLVGPNYGEMDAAAILLFILLLVPADAFEALCESATPQSLIQSAVWPRGALRARRPSRLGEGTPLSAGKS